MSLGESAIRQAKIADIFLLIEWKICERYRPELEERVRRISRTIRNRYSLEKLYEFYGPGLEVPNEEYFFNQWISRPRSQIELNRALEKTDVLTNHGDQLLKLGASPSAAVLQLENAYLQQEFIKASKLIKKRVPVTQRLLESLIKDDKNYSKSFPSLVQLGKNLDHEKLLNLILSRNWNSRPQRIFLRKYANLFNVLYDKLENKEVFSRLKSNFNIRSLLELRTTLDPSPFKSYIQFLLLTISPEEITKTEVEEEIRHMTLENFLSFVDSPQARFHSKLISRRAEFWIHSQYMRGEPNHTVIERLESLINTAEVNPLGGVFKTLISYRPNLLQEWLNAKVRTQEELDTAIHMTYTRTLQFEKMLEAGAVMNLDRENELHFAIQMHRIKRANHLISSGVRVPLDILMVFASGSPKFQNQEYINRTNWLRIDQVSLQIKFVKRIVLILKETYGTIPVEYEIQNTLETLFHHWLLSPDKDMFAMIFETLADEVPNVRSIKGTLLEKFLRNLTKGQLKSRFYNEIPNYRSTSHFGKFLREVRRYL